MQTSSIERLLIHQSDAATMLCLQDAVGMVYRTKHLLLAALKLAVLLCTSSCPTAEREFCLS